MKVTPKDMTAGIIHKTNGFGDLTIIDYEDAKNVTVQFIKTKFITVSQSSHIRRGRVKDVTMPTVHGVGYIGIGKHKAGKSCRHTKSYKAWIGMLERCYSVKLHKKRPTYIGCTVCDEWHNFQVFAKWFDENHVYGLHLDKDVKIKGNKVYSPEACMFVSQSENTIEAKAKRYKFLNPNGEIVDIYNLSKFSRENNLNSKSMSRVHLGSRNHHKGWTLPTRES